VLEGERLAGKLGVEHLVKQRRVPVNESVRLRFRLTDLQTEGPPSRGLTDVELLTNLMPGVLATCGTWPRREGNGVLQARLPAATPPGLYYIYVQCLSRGVKLQ